ncbi:glycosyltransferase [Candidatus Pelagibacter sp.]|uniref:glycosyltransferase n=1 Tax=Candidatus Pelagibacter sp. TaxID=2024849 RepID=UPI003F85765E
MISKKNLTVIIVSFASNDVIFNCIDSIDDDLNIVVIENSNNLDLKKKLEQNYKNVICILNSLNSGMGAGNNFGLSKINTEYALILNPDVVLENYTISELVNASKVIDKFSILAPIHSNKDYPNYKTVKGLEHNDSNFINVISVDGYAMLLNLKRIKKALNLKDYRFFDENIFMYLENDDLCKRLINKKEKIFIIKSSKINHLGAKGVSQIFKNQIELSRNWHWSWSRYYYKKKHFGFFSALLSETPRAINSLIKFFVYSMINHNRKKIYILRFQGFLNALLGKSSSYRPKIDLDYLKN